MLKLGVSGVCRICGAVTILLPSGECLACHQRRNQEADEALQAGDNDLWKRLHADRQAYMEKVFRRHGDVQ